MHGPGARKMESRKNKEERGGDEKKKRTRDIERKKRDVQRD